MLSNLDFDDITAQAQAVAEGFIVAISAFVFAAISGAMLYSIGQTTPYIGAPTSFSGRLVNIFALQVLSFSLITYVYLELTDRSFGYIDIAVPNQRQLGTTAIGIVTLIGINYVLSAFFLYIDIPTAPSKLTELSNPIYYLILGLLSFLIIAPAEELLFRGVIQKRLTESFSPLAAVFFTSLIFASLHFQALAGNEGLLASLATIFSLSCLLGITYIRTNNLIVPIIMHGFFNLFVFLVTYAKAVGFV